MIPHSLSLSVVHKQTGFATHTVFFCLFFLKLLLLVFVFLLHTEREERNCCEIVIRHWYFLAVNDFSILLLQDALPPPPPPPPQSSIDGATYSLAAGQRPSPSISDQSGRQRPTVWAIKTVPHKNMQSSYMCGKMSELVCAPMAPGLNANAHFRGRRLCLSVTPSAVCVRPQTVRMFPGEMVSWVQLESLSVTPDFWPPHLFYSSNTPHTWLELDPLTPVRSAVICVCLCMHARLWGIYVPLAPVNIEIGLKTSQLRLLSLWLPFQACSCTAVERWHAKCLVLQCWFVLGQRPQSLVEGLRGEDHRCTSRTNGMLYKMLNCFYFYKPESLPCYLLVGIISHLYCFFWI